MRKAPPSDPWASTHRPARPHAQRSCQHHSSLLIRPLRRRPARLSHPKTQAAPAPANHRQKKGSQSYKRPPIPAIVCQHPLLHAIRYQLNFPEQTEKKHTRGRDSTCIQNPWHASIRAQSTPSYNPARAPALTSGARAGADSTTSPARSRNPESLYSILKRSTALREGGGIARVWGRGSSPGC